MASMESRTATIATQRKPDHAVQPLPDGYSKKGASYRRPLNAQPASAQASIASPSTARTSAPTSTTNGMSRASSHRRRQSQQVHLPSQGTSAGLLPLQDASRVGPPTSYRDPYVPKGSSKPTRTPSSRSRDPTIQLNPSRQQPNITIAAERLQHLRSPPYDPAEPLADNTDDLTRRASHGRRPSVPDRSPLQKLEGKLDDISKEERRARILEAELAAQEKADAARRARRAQEATAKQPRVVSGPIPSGNAPKRAPSERRHVSLPVANPKSPYDVPLHDSGDEDDDNIYDLSEPWDPTGKHTSTGPHRVPSQSRNNRLSSGFYTRDEDGLDRSGIARSVSKRGKEPNGIERGLGSFRERSKGATTQHARQSTDRNRKASGGPTGLGLVGLDDGPRASSQTRAGNVYYNELDPELSHGTTPRANGIGRQDSKRDSRGIKAAQLEREQQLIDEKNDTGPHSHHAPTSQLPVRRSVGFADLPAQPDDVVQEHGDDPNFDVFSSHHDPDRRYIAPKMLEDWRTAPAIPLLAEDLDLDTPQRSNSGAKSGNKAWWEESTSARRRRSSSHAETSHDKYIDASSIQTTFNPPLYLKCGPLLRYTGLRREGGKPGKDKEFWRGSVMIVTTDEHSSYKTPPLLRLFKQPMDLLPTPPTEVNDGTLDPAHVDPLEGQPKVSRSGKTLFAKPVDLIPENEDVSRLEDDTGLFSEYSNLSTQPKKVSRIHTKDGEKLGRVRNIPAFRLHAERGVTFWRFNIEVQLGSAQARIAYRINRGPAIGFWVPAKGETMNIMFHSCNGFSLSVDPKQFCGPDPLWRDVLNNHQTRPFHVMIGGGDQIYNDAAMRDTTLFKQWTEGRNPLQKHHTPFSEPLQHELEQFYLDRYSMWFSQGLFGMANSQIPMINMWDDHDIIDGYGSYPHHFMQTPVFTGLGAIAFKYYMLFQHQSVPSETEKSEPSWLLGAHPGPYIKEQSRNLFLHLGRQVAFLGLDCRTERQRNEILTEDSYDVIFDRLEEELVKGETKHLIVLLGIPIAYPRLNFLENILTSRLMDPLKALGRAGMLGNFLNKFDGGVEILDDLDDHWTAKHHKEERGLFIRELQHIASTKSVRVTILGGDVHLAAVGQFYSNKKLGIPKDKDHRYMPNVVSSAIVNTPPPEIMADIINKRNKVHHLDAFTDEDMIPLFTHDVDGKKRNNKHLLQRRNWCSITNYKPGSTPPATPSPPGTPDLDGPKLTRTLSDYTPGKMVRRISASSRRASGPPISYYNTPAHTVADDHYNDPHSSFSPEPDERPRSRRSSFTSLFRRRASEDGARPPDTSHSVPAHRDPVNGDRDPSLERPSAFHRRPSVLGKSGMQQESEYINLQGGLDICLNLEVSQHDPAGITAPYRLLVPALDYTAPEVSTTQDEKRTSRLGGMFGAFKGGRAKRTIGDDGYSQSSASDSESDVEELDQEQRIRQRYKVGPRIIIPGFTNRKRKSQIEATAHAQPHDGDRTAHESPDYSSDNPLHHRRQSVDLNGDRHRGVASSAATPSSAWANLPSRRHVSAPVQSYNGPDPQTSSIPVRSKSNRQPTHNSSHKSQLPSAHHAAGAGDYTPTEEEPKSHRRSMGGILGQHRGEHFEHEAHVGAHTAAGSMPSRAGSRRESSKRDSYPPHPAIVGAGPTSPYHRHDMRARDDTGNGGDYFSSRPQPASASAAAPSSRDTARGAPQARNGTAGVGAKYLGRGRYADSEDEDTYTEDSMSGPRPTESQESFDEPRKRSWKIWKR